MTEFDVSIIIAGVIAGATPIVLAAIGETITEKAGLINLSLDGSILLAAMASFVVALKADSLLAGFVAGALVLATLGVHGWRRVKQTQAEGHALPSPGKL